MPGSAYDRPNQGMHTLSWEEKIPCDDRLCFTWASDGSPLGTPHTLGAGILTCFPFAPNARYLTPRV